MALRKISLTGIRCFSAPLTVPVDGRILVVQGPNGVGKTTLLEAIYLVLRGRSFRSSDHRAVVAQGSHGYEVRLSFYETGSDVGTELRRVYECQGPRANLTRDGLEIRQSEVTREFPLLMIDRAAVDLVSLEPSRRKALLDWVLFHVEQGYSELLHSYARSYRNWYGCLRRGHTEREENAWWAQLRDRALRVEDSRSAIFQEMRPHVEEYIKRLIPGRRISVGFTPATTEVLLERLRRRVMAGEGSYWGPRHASLSISVDGISDVRGLLSRGQQKRLAIAVLWSAASVVSEKLGKDVLILFDDFQSDFDSMARNDVLEFVIEYGHQTIIATNEPVPATSDLRCGGICSTWNIGCEEPGR